MKSPRFLLALGVGLLFLGAVLPFLVVIKLIDATFPLMFISSGSSTLGLALGMIGLAELTQKRP